MKLSVIIPVYNEEKTIADVIEKVKSAPLPDGSDREILAVDDGSTDHTAEVLDRYRNDPVVRLFRQNNMGKTAAVMQGIKNATGDILLIQDADLEYDPSHYSRLVDPIINEGVPVVYGSRFLGSIQNMRFWIRVANMMTNLTLNLIYRTKLSDINTCFKVFKKEALDGIDITSSHFGFDTEVTVKILKKGIRIHEIPIDYVGRSRQEGKKITFRTSFRSYLGILVYTFKER